MMHTLSRVCGIHQCIFPLRGLSFAKVDYVRSRKSSVRVARHRNAELCDILYAWTRVRRPWVN